jgi:hypothetical protein
MPHSQWTPQRPSPKATPLPHFQHPQDEDSNLLMEEFERSGIGQKRGLIEGIFPWAQYATSMRRSSQASL